MKEKFNNLLDNIFIFLLKRYARKRLDQWDRWEINTEHGPVYVEITRKSDGYNYEKLK